MTAAFDRCAWEGFVNSMQVQLCVKAQETSLTQGVKALVVSMPSWELFTAQDRSCGESVPSKRTKKRVTVEAAATLGWRQWAGDEGAIIGIDRHGASASGEEIFMRLGITAERVPVEALRRLGRSSESALPGKELTAQCT
jgi:transketolase